MQGENLHDKCFRLTQENEIYKREIAQLQEQVQKAYIRIKELNEELHSCKEPIVNYRSY